MKNIEQWRHIRGLSLYAIGTLLAVTAAYILGGLNSKINSELACDAARAMRLERNLHLKQEADKHGIKKDGVSSWAR